MVSLYGKRHKESGTGNFTLRTDRKSTELAGEKTGLMAGKTKLAEPITAGQTTIGHANSTLFLLDGMSFTSSSSKVRVECVGLCVRSRRWRVIARESVSSVGKIPVFLESLEGDDGIIF